MSQNDSHVNKIAMYCYLRNIYKFKHYNIILDEETPEVLTKELIEELV